MDNVFSLNYREYVAAEELAEALPKHEYSVFVPLSRQQQALDLLVYNLRTGRSASVQVKGSRSWEPHHSEYDRLLWFNTFKVSRPAADFYALVGIYRARDVTMRSKKFAWRPIVLLLPRDEAKRVMERILKQKRNKKFFYVEFDLDMRRVDLTRPLTKGGRYPERLRGFLLDRSVERLRRHLNGR